MKKGFMFDKNVQKNHASKVPIVTGMKMVVEFDRPYKNEHYICPGGYELNGKQFDFFTTYGKVLKDNLVTMEVSDPDLDSFPSAITKEEVLMANMNGKFDEFFIYTGEYDNPEINPVSIKKLTFFFSDGVGIHATSWLIDSINKIFLQQTEK